LLLIKFYYNFQIPDWLWVKIFFVIGLTIYHLISGRIFSQLQKDIFNFSSMQLRLWNEVATIFLVAIVFIVILKDTTNYLYGLGGMLVFAIVLLIAIKAYKKIRNRS